MTINIFEHGVIDVSLAFSPHCSQHKELTTGSLLK